PLLVRQVGGVAPHGDARGVVHLVRCAVLADDPLRPAADGIPVGHVEGRGVDDRLGVRIVGGRGAAGGGDRVAQAVAVAVRNGDAVTVAGQGDGQGPADS